MRKVSSAIMLNARSGLVHRSTPRERRQIRVVAHSCQIGANVARSARDCPRFWIRLKPGSIYLHTGRWIGDRAIGERASRLFPGRRAVHTIPAVGHFSNARPRDVVSIEPLGGVPRARARAGQARSYVHGVTRVYAMVNIKGDNQSNSDLRLIGN